MTRTIHVVPQTIPVHCLRCEARIVERWDPLRPICANCALEEELFDRELRTAV